MFVPQWVVRRNDALGSNAPDAQEHISTNASDWLWAAFSFITVCALAMSVLTFMVSALPAPSFDWRLTPTAEAKGQTCFPPSRAHDHVHDLHRLLLHGLRPRLYARPHRVPPSERDPPSLGKPLLQPCLSGPWLTGLQYVRYIQWFITFPLLLLELLLATGLSVGEIATAGFVGAFLVVMGLVGALIPSTYKWGYYVFGAVALFYIW